MINKNRLDLKKTVTMVMLNIMILLSVIVSVRLRGSNNDIGNIHGKDTTIELYCNDDDEALALEYEEESGKMVLGKSESANCQNGFKKCKAGSDDTFREIDVTERKYVYDACSNRPGCYVTAPNNTNALDYHYIEYKYSCLSKTRNLDMSHEFLKSVENYLYLYLNSTLTPVSRFCSITSSLPLQVYSMYIVLSYPSCRKIDIVSTNQTLFNCNDEAWDEGSEPREKGNEEKSLLIFSQRLNMSDEEVNITIDGYRSRPGENLWLKFKSEGGIINASCHEYIKPTTPDLVTAGVNRTSTSMAVRSELGYWIYIGAGMGVICILLVLIIICAVSGRDRDNKEDKPSKNNTINPLTRPVPTPLTNNNAKKETTLNPTYCDPIDFLTPQSAARFKNAGRPYPSPEYQTVSEIRSELGLSRGKEHKSISSISSGTGSGMLHKNINRSSISSETGSGKLHNNIDESTISSESGITSESGSDVTYARSRAYPAYSDC